MIMECIALAGFMLAVFVAGIAVGRLIEKIVGFIEKNDDQEHIEAQKNNRR